MSEPSERENIILLIKLSWLNDMGITMSNQTMNTSFVHYFIQGLPIINFMYFVTSPLNGRSMRNVALLGVELTEEERNLKMTDRLNQLSEIQRYLDDKVISEDYPGIIIEFHDSRLVKFSNTAANRPTSMPVYFGRLIFPMNPKDIICAIGGLVNPGGVNCFSTRTLLAFAPNNFQEYSSVLVRLAVYLSDPWFQSVLRQMPSGPTLGFTSSLKTNKIGS